MKNIFYLLFAFGFIYLTSCNNNEPEEILDPSIPIYQEYEVDFYENGVVNVFANFRKNNAHGTSVKLNNGAYILANGYNMTYFRASDYADYGVAYDYSASMRNEEIVFEFIRSNDKKYTNKVSITDITPISVQKDLSSLKNGELFKIGEESVKIDEILEVRLISLTNTQLVYKATVSIQDMTASFNNVPIGIYQLQVLNKKSMLTTENDKTALGMINIYYLDSAQVSITE